MRASLAAVAAVLLYPVLAWVIRVLLTAATAPFPGIRALNRSAAALRIVRAVVGFVCGAIGLAGAAWVAGRGGSAYTATLPIVVVVLVATSHLYWARPFRGTPQYADDMFSLLGEEAGIVAAVLALAL